MAANASKAVETNHECTLCGAEFSLYYAGETNQNRFCCKAHKNEWHSTFYEVSESRGNVLEHLADGKTHLLPFTDTVVRMSDKSSRAVPLIVLIEENSRGKFYQITEFGRKVLDKYREV